MDDQMEDKNLFGNGGTNMLVVWQIIGIFALCVALVIAIFLFFSQTAVR
ncbi:MAG: hypothetical protein CEN89_514 [Candidatus Berkelbacteria bacterium Licking1014_7]|uniref:Uncharacterized protein n=1 Tax=Candidatus Berkelbacteria bacterium Licking1014_7 TaxID=2017147 RepID=A0A554LIS0_9BACT|nr:MAG: hypothetical protein CEN89_514 [Candidatus Berkelbacteria bacterium Licking1014_7]